MALIMVPYVYEALIGLMETMWTYGLVFCGPNEINHFYCTDPPLLKLACSDTKIKETSMLVCAESNLIFSLLVILVSYLYIFFCYPEDAFHRRQAQSVLYLWLPSDSCHRVL